MKRTDSQYLESKVLDASQPQLHLMLLEGALRFGRNARQMWTPDSDFSAVDPLLARMSDVVDELAHGAANGQGDISQQLEEQYAFIYRELTACRFNEDSARLESCLKLLEYQRETWKQVCEKLDVDKIHSTPNPPHLPADVHLTDTGFSIEA